MFDLIKKRCGIADGITVYDEDIKAYIADATEDIKASGVPAHLVDQEYGGVVTAVTFYVKAHLGNDRTDTEKYMDLYLKKVFRLSMEDDENVDA